MRIEEDKSSVENEGDFGWYPDGYDDLNAKPNQTNYLHELDQMKGPPQKTTEEEEKELEEDY